MQSEPTDEISLVGSKLLRLAIHPHDTCHQSRLYGIQGLRQEREEGTYRGDGIQC